MRLIHLAQMAGIHEPLSRCQDRLQIDVTAFSPQPEHRLVSSFADERALVDAVLASCYIPVAYEDPIFLAKHGFCIDGCALHFLPNARFVVSPYHCHLGDISPAEEYSGTLVFNLLHGSDVLRLFEDGYLDACRWLEKGASSRRKERAALAEGGQTASLRALAVKGIQVGASIFGLRLRGPRISKKG